MFCAVFLKSTMEIFIAFVCVVAAKYSGNVSNKEIRLIIVISEYMKRGIFRR